MSPEPLLLIPGLSCTAALFAPQIAALEGRRAVLVADHRQDDTLPAIARRLLDRAPPRFALAGLSMGGYVALEVVRQAPERVTRLALLDTSARADTPAARENRERLIALACTGGLLEVHRVLWPRLVHPDRVGDRELEAVVRTMHEETGPETFIRQQYAIMARPDSRPLLSTIEVPTLVLVGDADVITPPEMAQEIAGGVEQASLALIRHCGHLSSLEQSEVVTDALRAWLDAPPG